MKLAINGFGRIGRAVLKIALSKGIDVVAVNDLQSPEDFAYLLKYDSIYGRYDKEVSFGKDFITIGKKKIKVLNEKDPEKLPWKDMGVDIVVESTGFFTAREGAQKHLSAGAKYVLISAPAKDPDATIVPGVNHKTLKKSDKIISVASCTTNCFTPVLKVLDDKFGINSVFMTTVHSFTNDQATHDRFHKKKRRGRAASLNIVPTSTGAAIATSLVLPKLKGKVEGMAIRVPTPVGSLVDMVVDLKKKAEVKDINLALKKASKGELKGILEYTDDEIVSTDVIGNSHSSIVDGLSTQKNGSMFKVLSWYDNEFGYSNRVVETAEILKKWLR